MKIISYCLVIHLADTFSFLYISLSQSDTKPLFQIPLLRMRAIMPKQSHHNVELI